MTSSGPPFAPAREAVWPAFTHHQSPGGVRRALRIGYHVTAVLGLVVGLIILAVCLSERGASTQQREAKREGDRAAAAAGDSKGGGEGGGLEDSQNERLLIGAVLSIIASAGVLIHSLIRIEAPVKFNPRNILMYQTAANGLLPTHTDLLQKGDGTTTSALADIECVETTKEAASCDDLQGTTQDTPQPWPQQAAAGSIRRSSSPFAAPPPSLPPPHSAAPRRPVPLLCVPRITTQRCNSLSHSANDVAGSDAIISGGVGSDANVSDVVVGAAANATTAGLLEASINEQRRMSHLLRRLSSDVQNSTRLLQHTSSSGIGLGGGGGAARHHQHRPSLLLSLADSLSHSNLLHNPEHHRSSSFRHGHYYASRRLSQSGYYGNLLHPNSVGSRYY